MPGKSEGLVWDQKRLSAPHVQPDKACRVRSMFDAIAPTYERINALTSGGRDAHWRRMMVRLAEVEGNDVMLDVACGTGDVARAFAAGHPAPAVIIGVDFSLPMLQQAALRPIRRGALSLGDALRLPIADAAVSLVTCAFGIRNFERLETGLREMHRVLRPGGRAVVLEFTIPRSAILRPLYLFYLNHILPRVATWVSHDRTGAYRYLPRSVLSFKDSAALRACFQAAGFSEVAVHPLSLGIVAVYVARKAAIGYHCS